MALGGLWRRLFGRAEPERRFSPAEAWYGGAPYGPAGASFFAENLSGVTSAITLISRTVGSLPWRVYRQTPQGRIEVDDHPVSRLLLHPDGPDGIWTLCDLSEWWLGQALLAGNSVLAIEDDGAGRPVRLRPIPWAQSNPQIAADGRVVFNVASGGFSPWWPGHMPVRVASDDALWLRDRPDASGIFGRSALSRCPEVLALAGDAQRFAATTFSSGARLSGVLLYPGKLSLESSGRLGQSWRDVHTGPLNAAKVAILEEGMTFSPLSMTLEDAELLASRKFQTEEIARLFNIPLPILNIWDHSTFTNSDTASQWFGQLTLAPWCRKIETEFARVLFNDPSYHLEIDLSALMRGSFATRIQSEINLVRSGILTPNEVRLAEGWPAMAGGDKLEPQAVGGRPGGTSDGEGDAPPALNGGGPKPNGTTTLQ